MRSCPCLLCLILAALLGACATAGQQYIKVAYTGTADPMDQTRIAVVPLVDQRPDTETSYLGRRILMDNSQETYLVMGMDLAWSLTTSLTDFLVQKGATTKEMQEFPESPEAAAESPKELSRIITGRVEKFEVQAQKKGALTEMQLDISLTFSVALPETGQIKTVPVAYSLEKTLVSFSRQKLETFVNGAVAEILAKAGLLE